MPEKKLDISKHILFPKHEILTKKEKKEVLKIYGTDISKYPRILVTDPAVKKYGGKPGDMIKITRNSPTAGTSVYYRVVVNE